MAPIISQAARDLITKFEGVRLTPYKDEAGYWTWGIGHKQKRGEQVPESLTQEQVEQIFDQDLETVAATIGKYITAPLTDNQFGALCSLVFNCGAAPLEQGLGQTLNQEDYKNTAGHFLLWDKITIDGELRVSDGLYARRLAEMKLFLAP